MNEFLDHLNVAHREVAKPDAAGEAHAVRISRRYDAPVEDVWEACTDPERLSRWFLPVTGDLRLGGRYQLQGNAGGEILRCEPPRLLALSWVYGDEPASQVEVRLSPGDGDDTVLELEHSGLVDPKKWDEFGPGAVGVGWDMGLLGLGLHLAGGAAVLDPQALVALPEMKEFMVASSAAWGAADEASGTSPAQAAAAAARTTAAYTGG